MANKYFFTKDPARYLALVANNEMKNPWLVLFNTM